MQQSHQRRRHQLNQEQRKHKKEINFLLVSPQQRLFTALLRDTHFFPKKEPGLSLYHITNQSLLYQVFVPFPS
jgi:hypothetical protein